MPSHQCCAGFRVAVDPSMTRRAGPANGPFGGRRGQGSADDEGVAAPVTMAVKELEGGQRIPAILLDPGRSHRWDLALPWTQTTWMSPIARDRSAHSRMAPSPSNSKEGWPRAGQPTVLGAIAALPTRRPARSPTRIPTPDLWPTLALPLPHLLGDTGAPLLRATSPKEKAPSPEPAFRAEALSTFHHPDANVSIRKLVYASCNPCQAIDAVVNTAESASPSEEAWADSAVHHCPDACLLS